MKRASSIYSGESRTGRSSGKNSPPRSYPGHRLDFSRGAQLRMSYAAVDVATISTARLSAVAGRSRKGGLGRRTLSQRGTSWSRLREIERKALPHKAPRRDPPKLIGE